MRDAGLSGMVRRRRGRTVSVPGVATAPDLVRRDFARRRRIGCGSPISPNREVCVKHVAAAARGARCIARATLREVVDGRKLFVDVDVDVDVVEGDRVIGVGTHQRRVIDVRGS